jgi:phosphate transport system substrate-binding protein
MASKVKKWLMFPLAATVILGLTLVPGCAGGGEIPQGETELSGTITESGSTSVKPLSEKFADAFMEKHPKVRIEIAGGGSSKGVSNCAAGISDIGAVSRDVKITEPDLIYYPVARDAVAIVVNEANPITDLTMEQVAKVYVGDITKWSELGWKDGGDITVYCREVGSGTLDCFASKVLKAIGKDEEDVTPDAERFDSNGGMQIAVQADSWGMGFVSLGYVQGLKVLKLEGVECTVETCLSGEYPVLRRLAFVTKACPSDPVKAFIDFCRSPEAQQMAEEAGYVPLVVQ